MKKLRVGLMSYVVDNRPAKGTAVYARKIIEGLKQDPRFDVTLIHYDKSADEMYQGVKEVQMKYPKIPGGHFFGQLWFYFTHKDQFDIIHWFQPRLYPFFWLAPARLKTVTLHGAGMVASNNGFYFSNWIFNKTIQLFGGRISRSIASTYNAKNEIVKHYRLSPNAVEVMYLGVGDLYTRQPEGEAQLVLEKAFSIRKPFILNVSRLQPHKNVVSLIEAYDLYRKIGSQELLVIVGTNTDESAPIFDRAKNSPYRDDIIFLSNVASDELRALYSAAQVFVLLSLDEGFGLPVVEAMACGTPVIVSDRTSLPEVVHDAGVVVPAFGYEEAARAMHELIHNKEKRNEMIGRGYLRSQFFTWEKTIQGVSEMFLQLGTVIDCPVCANKEVAKAVAGPQGKHDEYQLYHCSHCAVSFWTPFKNPGGEWYEKDERYAGANKLPPLDPNWNHKKVISFLSGKQGKVLDVGCGTGNFLAWAEKNGWQGWGIDFDKNAIQSCKDFFGLARCEVNDILSFERKNREQFSLITFYDVIEHIDNHQEFFASVKRMLSGDGYVSMSMPYGNGYAFLQPNDLPPRHLTRWNEGSLAFFLQSLGFRVDYLKKTPASVYFIALKIKNRFKKKASFGVMKNLQKKEVGSKKGYSATYRALAFMAKLKDLLIYGLPAVLVWLALLPTNERYVGLYVIAKRVNG